MAPGTQVEYWDIAHVLTDENRLTPHPIGDFTGTLSATAGNFSDTTIELPTIGWIHLVGTLTLGNAFSIYIPVSLITDLTACSVAGALGSDRLGTDAVQFATGVPATARCIK